MKYLIVGLGNPGEEYYNTRHNIGFMILDKILSKKDGVFNEDKFAQCTKINHKGRTLFLIKPNLFMNNSGKSVLYWVKNKKIDLNNLLIVSDDLSLDFGKLRLRRKGSDGGHNGLKSINKYLNSSDYPRLRFGIGSEFKRGKQSQYVLEEWNDLEKENLKNRVELAVEMILSFVSIGISHTMNKFNVK